MNKIVKIIIVLVFVLAVLFLLALNLPKNNSSISKVCFKDSCFKVEVVSAPKEMQNGLMFRDYLEKDRGMLFIFKREDNYPFWMKNTLIPLDMIWINQNQEIVFIKENALPCYDVSCPSIEPGQKAKYVLEINGGVSKDVDLKLGDKIILF